MVLLLLAIPLGRYVAKMMEGRLRFGGRIEAGLFRLCGIKADTEPTVEVIKYQEPKQDPDGQPPKNDKGEPVLEEKTTAKQTLAMGRRPRRSRSRCSAPMVAATPTRTRPIHTRTRPR